MSLRFLTVVALLAAALALVAAATDQSTPEAGTPVGAVAQD